LDRAFWQQMRVGIVIKKMQGVVGGFVVHNF